VKKLEFENRIFTIEEFCEFFSCSPQTANKLFAEKKIDGKKVNRKWYTTLKSIYKYLEENE
jgi:hypothetical protein